MRILYGKNYPGCGRHGQRGVQGEATRTQRVARRSYDAVAQQQLGTILQVCGVFF